MKTNFKYLQQLIDGKWSFKLTSEDYNTREEMLDDLTKITMFVISKTTYEEEKKPILNQISSIFRNQDHCINKPIDFESLILSNAHTFSGE
jgi:hypothetical protein